MFLNMTKFVFHQQDKLQSHQWNHETWISFLDVSLAFPYISRPTEKRFWEINIELMLDHPRLQAINRIV